MKPSPARSPLCTVDAKGAPIVRVPLARGGYATLDEADFDALMMRGFSALWCLNQNNRCSAAYVVCWHPGRRPVNMITVARLILNAAPRVPVRYADADKTNLRRSNLYFGERRAPIGVLRELAASRVASPVTRPTT